MQARLAAAQVNAASSEELASARAQVSRIRERLVSLLKGRPGELSERVRGLLGSTLKFCDQAQNIIRFAQLTSFAQTSSGLRSRCCCSERRDEMQALSAAVLHASLGLVPARPYWPRAAARAGRVSLAGRLTASRASLVCRHAWQALSACCAAAGGQAVHAGTAGARRQGRCAGRHADRRVRRAGGCSRPQ